MSQNISLKAKVICDLHKVRMLEFETVDMTVHIAGMNAILDFHNLKFKDACDIDPSIFLDDIDDIEASFFEAENCLKCNDLSHFAMVCEAFIDFSEVIRKDNDANRKLGKPYAPIAIVTKVDEHTILVSPVKNVA